jgi:hypothetical protein
MILIPSSKKLSHHVFTYPPNHPCMPSLAVCCILLVNLSCNSICPLSLKLYRIFSPTLEPTSDTHTYTHLHTHAHARTHARTHTHTHTTCTLCKPLALPNIQSISDECTTLNPVTSVRQQID